MTVPIWLAPGMLNITLKITMGQNKNWMSTKYFCSFYEDCKYPIFVSIDSISQCSTCLLAFSCLALPNIAKSNVATSEEFDPFSG